MKKRLATIRRAVAGLVVFLVCSTGANAQTNQTITLQNLSAFKDPGESWQIAGGVRGSLEKENYLETDSGNGILINTPEGHNGRDLYTKLTHGDMDLALDFMMAKGSNSGIYLQGRYEIQLRDSWTVNVPTAADNGGIYERWDESRPEGEKGFQGYAPRQNASRAPGIWQHMEISFQAPRFDEEGNKIKNARILSITLNGVTIHENIELFGPTRGAIGEGEVAQGPLRLQGDHGAVAFRNIEITRYNKRAPTLSDLQYKVFEGAFRGKPDPDTLTAVKSGAAEQLTANLGAMPDQYLLTYNGVLHNKQAGTYTFGLDAAGGGGQLLVDGKEVIGLQESEGSIQLPSGSIPFEVWYARLSTWQDPNIGLSVKAEGLRAQMLSENKLSGLSDVHPIYVRAEEKPLLRSFRDLPGGTRITHAVSVGSLDKVHYTYDLKHGNLIQLWRGGFLNATPMWYSRGDGSSVPHGSIQNLLLKPAYAINTLENKQAPWTRESEAAQYQSHGYVLDINDNPTFKYEVYGTRVQDKIRVTGEGKGIARTLQFQDAPDDLYMRLAVGSSIRKIGKNQFLVDDQSYYLQVNDATDAKPFIRTSGEQQELLIPVQSTINYTILF